MCSKLWGSKHVSAAFFFFKGKAQDWLTYSRSTEEYNNYVMVLILSRQN